MHWSIDFRKMIESWMPKRKYHLILRRSWIIKCVCSSANAGTRRGYSSKPFHSRMKTKLENVQMLPTLSYRPYITPDLVRIIQLDILAPAVSTLESQPVYPSSRRRAKSCAVHPYGSCECSLAWLVTSGRKSPFLSRSCGTLKIPNRPLL